MIPLSALRRVARPDVHEAEPFCSEQWRPLQRLHYTFHMPHQRREGYQVLAVRPRR